MSTTGTTNNGSTDPSKEGMTEVFCRYIVRNGKKIYPKRGKLFHFWVKAKQS